MEIRGQRGKPRVVARRHTEESIQKALWLRKPIVRNPRYEMFNLRIYAWESDYLAVTKGGRVYETEIKVSHADFLNEAKHKEKKMVLLAGTIVTEENFYGFRTADYDRQMPKPNYFYYVCPQGVIAPEEVPAFAGLVYITEEEGFSTVKSAPELHRKKHAFAAESLCDKFYWGMWNWIRRCWRTASEKKDIAPQTAAAYEKALSMYAEEVSALKEEIMPLTTWREVAPVQREGFASEEALDRVLQKLPRLVRDKRDGCIELIDYDNACEWRGDLERHPSRYQWRPVEE